MMQTIINVKTPSPSNRYKKAKGKNKFNILTAYCSKGEALKEKKISDTNAFQQIMFTSLKK